MEDPERYGFRSKGRIEGDTGGGGRGLMMGGGWHNLRSSR